MTTGRTSSQSFASTPLRIPEPSKHVKCDAHTSTHWPGRAHTSTNGQSARSHGLGRAHTSKREHKQTKLVLAHTTTKEANTDTRAHTGTTSTHEHKRAKHAHTRAGASTHEHTQAKTSTNKLNTHTRAHTGQDNHTRPRTRQTREHTSTHELITNTHEQHQHKRSHARTSEPSRAWRTNA